MQSSAPELQVLGGHTGAISCARLQACEGLDIDGLGLAKLILLKWPYYREQSTRFSMDSPSKFQTLLTELEKSNSKVYLKTQNI